MFYIKPIAVWPNECAEKAMQYKQWKPLLINQWQTNTKTTFKKYTYPKSLKDHIFTIKEWMFLEK